MSKLFCAAFKEIPQVYVPVRSLWGLQAINMLMFLWGFCRCSCLILAAACASASFLASPTPWLHANSTTSDTKCTFPVRPQYVPSTFRWLLFWIFSCSTRLAWSAFLPVPSATLLSINVRPWPGLCSPPCSCTFHCGKRGLEHLEFSSSSASASSAAPLLLSSSTSASSVAPPCFSASLPLTPHCLPH